MLFLIKRERSKIVKYAALNNSSNNNVKIFTDSKEQTFKFLKIKTTMI